MSTKVVYVIGAGFSAPLGLPVVANFHTRSRDLFADDPKRFAHFEAIFTLVRQLSYAKNYYRTDLFNIEELLSMLEMGEFAESTALRDSFVRYLADVVLALTPPPPSIPSDLPGTWKQAFLGEHSTWASYCLFVANLCGLRLTLTGSGKVARNRLIGGVSYGMVSLNYDMVLESALSLIRAASESSEPLEFTIVTKGKVDPSGSGPLLAKIHGSVHDESIIPPTWNKAGRDDLSPAWAAALQELRSANFIRFMGYSLPETDAYVRYLLKYAGVRTEHLKGIDIICQDPDGKVKSRYESFIELPLRFANRDIENYLRQLRYEVIGRPSDAPMVPELEAIHEAFMNAQVGA